MPIAQNREYRQMSMPLAMPLGEKRFNTDFYVEGIATTYNSPYLLYEDEDIKIYEQIDKNALLGADLSDVIMQYNHEGKVLARNSNNTLSIESTDIGVIMFSDLSKSEEARELYEEIANGLITKMSWAWIAADECYDKSTRTRTILKIKKVYDVSAVSYPANPETQITVRSYFNGVIEEQKRETLARRRQLLKLKLNLEV